MNKTTSVVFLLLLSSQLFASALTPEINKIESQWAKIYYAENSKQQSKHFPLLIEEAEKLSKKYPKALEPIVWQAIIIATNAAFESPFKALESIQSAKALLEHVISVEPETLEGAALVTLGTLYYMSPGWPISFGNQQTAESLLKKALKINPLSIDSNYFYADYLVSKGNLEIAQAYFKKALNAPTRNHQEYADTQLKKEALSALKSTERRKLEAGKNKFLSLFSSAKSD